MAKYDTVLYRAPEGRGSDPSSPGGIVQASLGELTSSKSRLLALFSEPPSLRTSVLTYSLINRRLAGNPTGCWMCLNNAHIST